MQCFEILIAQAQISKNGGPFIDDQQLTYYIPDEAQEVLGPILGNYNLDPEWYFDSLFRSRIRNCRSCCQLKTARCKNKFYVL